MSEKNSLKAAYWNLPLSKAWNYIPFMRSNISVAPTQTTEFFDFEWAGWVIFGIVIQDNPNLVGIFEIETDEQVYTSEFTANTLLATGVMQPVAAGWWLSRYDATNSVYVVTYTPAAWTPFYRRFRLAVRNPTAATINVPLVSVLMAHIKEVEE